MPSLRDCHSYAISEAGARRPLPISPPPCTLLFTPAPPYFPHPPCQSSLKGPGGILPWLPHEDRNEDKEMHRNKKSLKKEDPVPSTCFLEPTELPMFTWKLLLLLLLWLLISISPLLWIDPAVWGKMQRSKPPLNPGTFLVRSIDGTLVRLLCPHTLTHTHTHSLTYRHALRCCRVFLSELPAASSACCLERTGNTMGSTRNSLTHTSRHRLDLIHTCTHQSFEAAGK